MLRTITSKIIFISFIAFLLTVNEAFARTRVLIDSLKKELTEKIHDTTRVVLYHEISRQYTGVDLDSADMYANMIIEFTNERIPPVLTQPVIDPFVRKMLKYKAHAYYTIGETHSYVGDFTEAIPYYYKAIKWHDKAGYPRGIAEAYTPLGICQYAMGDFQEAISYFKKSLEIYEELEDMDRIASSYNNIGIIYRNQGLFEKAAENYLFSLRVYIDVGNKRGEASASLNLGIVHRSLGNFQQALNYSNEALRIFKEEGASRNIYRAYNNTGMIYEDLANSEEDETKKSEYFQKAVTYYRKSLKYAEETGDRYAMSAAYSNIGNIYRDSKEFSKAEYYYLKALKIDKEIGDKAGLSIIYSSLAALYINIYDSITQKTGDQFIGRENLNKAMDYAKKSHNLASDVGSYTSQRSAAKLLYEAYGKVDEYGKAFKYALKFIDANSIVFNEESARALTEMQEKYEAEKRELEISNLNKENALRKAELAQSEEKRRRQLTVIYFFIGGFFVVVTLSAIIFRLFLLKKKANIKLAEQKEEILEKNALLVEANEEIRAQKEEIEAQHDVVLKQKEFIEIQKQRIDSSIRYAKRIQNAVLPSDSCIKPHFAGYFVMYRPKDVVSGDFYYSADVGDWVMIVAADCTGHGVPGAFMSMLGISTLNQISATNAFNNAADILNELRDSVVNALKQSLSEESQVDGMDISLAIINKKTLKCHWAGANNPLWIVRANNIENNPKDSELIVEEIKGDKMPVAIFVKMNKYENHEIQLNKGDKLYMFSDGFVDQFGGLDNKKFNKKTFKKLIAETTSLSMDEQKLMLENTFDNWVKPREDIIHDQIDDVVVLGVQI